MDDVSRIRLRLAEIVLKTESDEEFARRLADNPSAVFFAYGVPDGAVDEINAVSQEEDRGGAEEICIHTKGCADFTCFTSACPNTCKITIVIDAPDS
ncbi:MAG: hypothetical protein QOH13_1065 [Thermoleophilaceae bacterium]|jgi:hypothetical protein|nr:hypothetical protein [Thermoleophilaceae bacterium]